MGYDHEKHISVCMHICLTLFLLTTFTLALFFLPAVLRFLTIPLYLFSSIITLLISICPH